MNARELIKLLTQANFKLDRSGKGSHQIYRHLTNGTSISVPVHKGKDIGKGLGNKILKQAGINKKI